MLAEQAFLRALEISPSNARAAVKLGGVLLDNMRPVPAIEAFRTALASDPSLEPAWNGLIIAYRMAGRDAEVIGLVNKLEESEPELAASLKEKLKATPRAEP